MANLITLIRVGMLFVAIGLIYTDNYSLIFLAGWLIAIAFAGDGLDGWIARRRGSESPFGAVFDIAGDRIAENVLWVVFAHLDVVPIWVPLVVLSRSFFVDVIRSSMLQRGYTPFGEKTMMRSPLTQFLTAGRFSRAYYGWSKALAFVLLTWYYAWQLPGNDGRFLSTFYDVEAVRWVMWFVVYSSVVICVVRGLPVLYDALYYFREDDTEPVPEPEAAERPISRVTAEKSERGHPI